MLGKKITLVLLVFVGVVSCDSTNDVAKDTPDCIEQKINDIENEPVWNPPAKVFSYTFQGEEVYYIPSRCCDIRSILYDKTCEIICYPDGGITGGGDGLCPDFFETRTNEKLIWEDKREE